MYPALHSRISLLIHSQGNSGQALTPSSPSTPLLPAPLPLGHHKSILQVHELLFCGILFWNGSLNRELVSFFAFLDGLRFKGDFVGYEQRYS